MPVVNTVYFDPAVGGTGLTVSDDGNNQTGLDADGHRVRFVPALQNLVYIGNFVKQRAADVDAAVDEVTGILDEAIAAKNTIEGYVDDSADSALLAEKWASQLTYPVADTRWSAREYANQAKSIADSMVNNIGLSRVDGGDSFTSIWSSSIDSGSSGTVATVNINCGNAI
jgi:hypothetical protein